MKRALKYILSGLAIWVLILSVNWVSYSISNDAIKVRGDLSLTVNQADLPFSGLESNETKSVSFSQRSINENKQQVYHLFDFSFDFSSNLFSTSLSSYLSSARIFIYKPSPFDLLTHQFLI